MQLASNNSLPTISICYFEFVATAFFIAMPLLLLLYTFQWVIRFSHSKQNVNCGNDNTHVHTNTEVLSKMEDWHISAHPKPLPVTYIRNTHSIHSHTCSGTQLTVACCHFALAAWRCNELLNCSAGNFPLFSSFTRIFNALLECLCLNK